LYQSVLASGADLMASIPREIALPPGQSVMVPTGVWLEIPPGYEAQVRSRSGLAAKFGIACLNAPGTIDSDYRGEVMVILVNHGVETYTVADGDRIAQLVIAPVTRAVFNAACDLAASDRGSGGFGSTGR